MKIIAGSILILAAAILMHPVDYSRMEAASIFASPVFLFGIVLIILGFKSDKG